MKPLTVLRFLCLFSTGLPFAIIHQQHASIFVTGERTSSASSLLSKTAASVARRNTIENRRKKYTLIQVQIIHRHGDRTPITPMNDVEYWKSTLPTPNLLSKMAEGTTVLRHEEEDVEGNKKQQHAASGVGPFGKLTQLGLFQMVEVGSRIREELYLDDEPDDKEKNTADGENSDYYFAHEGKLFTKNDPLHPRKVKVKSTDFPRTLQSVQAVLVGLFPDGYSSNSNSNNDGIDHSIEIDARHTDVMIPDPQPRLTREQIELEMTLSRRQHLLDKEYELKNVASKVTEELKSFIGADANSVNFGIGEEDEKKKNSGRSKRRPLSWSQLSEIMTCLKVRGLLPTSITEEEYHTVTSHSAWKWFENLRHAHLAKLATKTFMNFIMKNLHCGRHNENDDETKLHIFSCHDSSLIGLMCAFRLQQPSEWPEYGSVLKIELFEAESMHSRIGDNEAILGGDKEYHVRFSLNGNVLKSHWGLGEGDYEDPLDMIPLDHLSASIDREHGVES